MSRVSFAFPKAALLSAALAFLATGCGLSNFGGSRQGVIAWAQARNFVVRDIDAGPFHLFGLECRRGGGDTLTVYIEGDGAPWVTAYHPPRDPTPPYPLALALAEADPSAMIFYLGRPCQYLDGKALAGCDQSWWTERRFAPELIEAYGVVLDRLKAETGVSRLRLRGYSGGGVIAMLAAARRNDVEQVITVAAPLSLNRWVAWHGVSPLTGSLDPVEEPGKMPAAIHWAGSADRIVPAAILEHYVAQKGGRLKLAPGYDHQCCWAGDWAERLGSSSVTEDER